MVGEKQCDISNHMSALSGALCHLITCFKEHRDRLALRVAMHFADCELKVNEEDIVILVSNKSEPCEYILEALFVWESGTETLLVNTQLKDDYSGLPNESTAIQKIRNH